MPIYFVRNRMMRNCMTKCDRLGIPELQMSTVKIAILGSGAKELMPNQLAHGFTSSPSLSTLVLHYKVTLGNLCKPYCFLSN